MLPAQRGQVLQLGVIDGLAVATQGVRGPFQIDSVGVSSRNGKNRTLSACHVGATVS